ncbi:MAG: AMP-binding protein [Acidobacteria bacterium]|nr:AMP-binding protein [Acidobacteriota bacterium]
MNLAHYLETSAQCFPGHPVIREEAGDISYGKLNEAANRVASALVRLGIKPGDLVALCAPNSGDWMAFYFGALKAGAVAVTLSFRLKSMEFNNLLRHARPRMVYADAARLPDLEALKGSGLPETIICPGGDMDLETLMSRGTPRFRTVERDRRDTVAVLYTGGTTGNPKGVMLTQEGMDFSCQSIALYERYARTDVSLCFLPFNHVYGQIYIMNSVILSGGSLELMSEFDMARILWLLDQERLTRFYAVPTIYTRFIDVPDLSRKFEKVRCCFSGGAPMAAGILNQWKELTGMTVADGYGLTEMMPVTYNHFHLDHHLPGSVGQPVFGVELEIRDKDGNQVAAGEKGEVSVRGANLMKGYLQNPDATAEAFWPDGWLRTGDVGTVDSRGYVYIVDRLKDLIITGGENVYPREVEEVLYTRPEIEDCSVVGVQDREWGERVVAYIVPRQGRTLVAAELHDFLESRLSSFKVPKEYIRVTELPKSPQGKILRREVRKLHKSTA